MDEKGTSAHYVPMKHIYLQMAAGLTASFMIGTGSACAQQQDPAAQTETESGHWLDAPQTPGDWAYVSETEASFAYFEDTANPDDIRFMLRCDRVTRQVMLARGSPAPGEVMMRIRTETRDQLLTAEPVPMTGLVAVSLSANDPLLDAMAVTKGRFAVEVEGMQPLYIPAWAEVTRVIEDCR